MKQILNSPFPEARKAYAEDVMTLPDGRILITYSLDLGDNSAVTIWEKSFDPRLMQPADEEPSDPRVNLQLLHGALQQLSLKLPK